MTNWSESRVLRTSIATTSSCSDETNMCELVEISINLDLQIYCKDTQLEGSRQLSLLLYVYTFAVAIVFVDGDACDVVSSRQSFRSTNFADDFGMLYYTICNTIIQYIVCDEDTRDMILYYIILFIVCLRSSPNRRTARTGERDGVERERESERARRPYCLQ